MRGARVEDIDVVLSPAEVIYALAEVAVGDVVSGAGGVDLGGRVSKRRNFYRW